jgi:hypothetical protein
MRSDYSRKHGPFDPRWPRPRTALAEAGAPRPQDSHRTRQLAAAATWEDEGGSSAVSPTPTELVTV